MSVICEKIHALNLKRGVKNLNIAIILAGGLGKRMGKVKLPKQFLELNSTPIIILTLQEILSSKLFQSVIIVIEQNWREYLGELLESYEIPPLHIINGGKERIDSIENALLFLCDFAKNDDIIVFCDAVRPFINKNILQNSITHACKFGASVAITPCKDTMIISKNNFAISIPNRNEIFAGQAPDSFKFGVIFNALKNLPKNKRKIITGTAQICQMQGIRVATFLGDEKNIKITTILDLHLANAICKELNK